MTRWKPDARGRMVAAAMELFAERGFERTTVAEIAARAGLHEGSVRRILYDVARRLANVRAGACSCPTPASNATS